MNRTAVRVVVVTALSVAIGSFFDASTLQAQINWPQFRGPGSKGTSNEIDLPETWSKTENVVWNTKIPGRGWSSPVVWGDKIFLTSAIKLDGKEEAVKPGLYFGGERTTPKEKHRWFVTCLDFNTGKVLWEKTAHEGVPKEGHHLKNSLASETPATDGERLYVYFGNVGLFAYDLDGKPLWHVDIEPQPTAFNWGTASSPVVYGGRVFIVNDNEKKSYVAAFDAKTGNKLWSVDRDEKSNWATPFVWENDLRTELVTCGKNKVRSYDLDGKLLWELGGMSSIVIPTPFSSHGMLFVTSGYVLSPFKPLFAIKPGAKGDITLKDKATSNQFIAWSQLKAGPYNVSPLVYGDTMYILYDRGFFAAYDVNSGKPLYTPAMVRLGSSEHYTSSPWAYNGKIFCLSEEGETLVIPAGPKFEIVHKNPLDELCMASPALVRGSLLIRTESQLYRIAKKQPQQR